MLSFLFFFKNKKKFNCIFFYNFYHLTKVKDEKGNMKEANSNIVNDIINIQAKPKKIILGSPGGIET